MCGKDRIATVALNNIKTFRQAREEESGVLATESNVNTIIHAAVVICRSPNTGRTVNMA